MAKLIYFTIMSLDGYVADEDGKFDWAEPDEEVHSFVNDLVRPVGTYLYGRRMYEVLVAWATISLADQARFIQDFAEIWRAADKIVYSKTLETVSSAKNRARLRPRSGPGAESDSGARHHGGRARPCRPGAQGRVGRRDPPGRRARRGGRRHRRSPRQCPPEARAAGRTALRQRHGSPPLPHQDVRSRPPKRSFSPAGVGRRRRTTSG
jgi:RibD C-terminal domain